MKRRLFAIISIVVILAGSIWPGPAMARGEVEETSTCYYSFDTNQIYLPFIQASGGDMAKSDIAARLATARQRLSKALGTQFQNRITYRQGQVDFVEYDDQGRLVRATMTVDGVANIPVIASAGDALQVGDSIRVVNRGTPANPQYKYDMHDMSSYPAAAVSPAATLPTPTGLALTSTLRIPTSGGQVSTITASWRALADSIMQNGVYEVEIKRNEDVEAHTSRCPHRVGSTALNGSATFNDSSITVDSTASFPSTGRILIADAEISYTGKTTTTFTGLTWHSGSGTYADNTEVTGLTVAFTFDHVEPGRQYNVRVRAVSVTGAVSEWTSTSSITTTGNQQLQIQDNFDQYGGLLTSPLESLWFLQILHMDSLDEFFNHSYASIDTAHNVEGSGALHFSGTAPGGNAYAYCNMDLSVENRFTDADYLMVYIYVESLSDTGKAITRFAFAVDSGNYYLYEVTLTSTGAHYVKMKKSDFSVSGSPDWANITMFWVWQVTDGTTFPVVDIDDIRLVKADEADGTVYNDTGTTWDFVPQQGNGSEWHIYPGNRPGEPSKPFSLGQIKKAASPSTWYLGYHTLADAYYATAVVGGYLKGVNGQIALAFCIQDPALATRTLYAVEADSTNDKVRLVKWVNGSRTQIAQADFTFAPNQIIWLGADWRDFDNENRIKVYATLTEGNVIQAANLVISTTNANVARGGPVGVMTKEANARFVDFRAGSPQHAMTAEIAFEAKHLETPYQHDIGIRTTPTYVLHVASDGAKVDDRIRIDNTKDADTGNYVGLDLACQTDAQLRTVVLIRGRFTDITDATRSGELIISVLKSGSPSVLTLDGDMMDLAGRYVDIDEISAPAAPASNTARLFVRDNGSGKTQLCVRFPTGAIQVLATEP